MHILDFVTSAINSGHSKVCNVSVMHILLICINLRQCTLKWDVSLVET